MDKHPCTVLCLLVSEAIAFLSLWCIVAAILRVIYNLYFHPLSHFPGPPGAACTELWLTYMEIWKGVDLTKLRFELHDIYGM